MTNKTIKNNNISKNQLLKELQKIRQKRIIKLKSSLININLFIKMLRNIVKDHKMELKDLENEQFKNKSL